jgi:hypothetical protein
MLIYQGYLQNEYFTGITLEIQILIIRGRRAPRKQIREAVFEYYEKFMQE